MRTAMMGSIDLRRTRAILACAFLLIAGAAMAQHSVQVVVMDSATAEPLPGASANITGTRVSASTDGNGHLLLNNVPAGPQTLHVVSIGYTARDLSIVVPVAGTLTVRLQSGSTELEEAIVSVTRTNSRIDDAPQKIEVLGEEELTEEGSLKPGNMLSMIGDFSSVQVQQLSAASGASVVRMQGLDGRYTLLLRDGMPAFGGLSGGFDLLRIPPLDLQRVELLKGPASTFNGGGAIAGSLNFVSKQPTDSLSALLLVNRSTLAETNMNAYASGPIGNAGFTLFAGGTLQDARDVNSDGYSDLPNARTYLVHPQVFATPWRNGKVRAGVLWQNDERTGGNMGALNAPDDTARFFMRTHGERIGGDAAVDHSLSKQAGLTVKGSWARYSQRDRDNFSHASRTQDNLYTEAQWTHRTARRTWVAGGNVLRSALSGDQIAPQDLSTVGAFTQLALHRVRWPEVDIGLRVDAPDGYDVQVLPAIAALYKLSEHFLLRANLGTGYQLPDRSRNYGLAIEGRDVRALLPGTKPERSVGGTVEWTWKHAWGEHTVLFIDQTFFATSIDAPLQPTLTAEGITALTNGSGRALTRGVDNYVRLTHGRTEVYVGYTCTLPEYMFEGSTLTIPYTPEHRAAFTLAQEFGEHWRAGIEASWSGTQLRYDGSRTRDQLFAAGMVGWHAGMFTIVLNGENLTDTRQTRWEPIVSGTSARPVFAPLWAPLDGRVINLSVMLKI